jgi:hypothetical protein
MSASCVAGQTTTWDGTPAIFTPKPGPGAAHADTYSCVVAWWAGWGAAVLGSNSGGEFGEAVRDPVPRINVGAKFVVAAVEVLNEGVALR